jgi:hypothetical protein
MTIIGDPYEIKMWRESVCELARAILEGRVAMAAGIFDLDYFCTCLDPQMLMVVSTRIKGICSELDTIPHPDNRHRYSADLLKRADESLDFYKENIQEVCAEIIRLHGHEDVT